MATATRKTAFRSFSVSARPEIVGETAKAYRVQVWFGSSANPAAAARNYWIPKAAATVIPPRGAGLPLLSAAALWWVTQNRLWDCVD